MRILSTDPELKQTEEKKERLYYYNTLVTVS